MMLQRLLCCFLSLLSLLLGCHSCLGTQTAEMALIQGSSLSSFMVCFPGSASTTEISSQGAYCSWENACFNYFNFKALAVPVAAPQLSPKSYLLKIVLLEVEFPG